MKFVTQDICFFYVFVVSPEFFLLFQMVLHTMVVMLTP